MVDLLDRAERRTPLSALLRAIIAGVFGYVWWTENVVLGNGVALRTVGWFTDALPSLRDYALPALPSVFQLFLTEDVGGILATPAMGLVSILVAGLDVVGPAYGWLIRNEITSPTLWQLGEAALRGIFVSWIAQHVAWVNVKWLWGYVWQDVVGGLRRRPAAKPATGKGRSRRRRLGRPRLSARTQGRGHAAPPTAPEELAEEPADAEQEPVMAEIVWQNGAFMERR